MKQPFKISIIFLLVVLLQCYDAYAFMTSELTLSIFFKSFPYWFIPEPMFIFIFIFTYIYLSWEKKDREYALFWASFFYLLILGGLLIQPNDPPYESLHGDTLFIRGIICTLLVWLSLIGSFFVNVHVVKKISSAIKNKPDGIKNKISFVYILFSSLLESKIAYLITFFIFSVEYGNGKLYY